MAATITMETSTATAMAEVGLASTRKSRWRLSSKSTRNSRWHECSNHNISRSKAAATGLRAGKACTTMFHSRTQLLQDQVVAREEAVVALEVEAVVEEDRRMMEAIIKEAAMHHPMHRVRPQTHLLDPETLAGLVPTTVVEDAEVLTTVGTGHTDLVQECLSCVFVASDQRRSPHQGQTAFIRRVFGSPSHGSSRNSRLVLLPRVDGLDTFPCTT